MLFSKISRDHMGVSRSPHSSGQSGREWVLAGAGPGCGVGSWRAGHGVLIADLQVAILLQGADPPSGPRCGS